MTDIFYNLVNFFTTTLNDLLKLPVELSSGLSSALGL